MPNLSGQSFKASDVVDHYIHRPPYAPQLFPCLTEHLPPEASLLDLGCGEGRVARRLSAACRRVVAVDPSANMIALGKTLENGRAANIEWIQATAEDAPLDGPFDMATFASSIHWMSPVPLFDTLRHHLKPIHLVAVISGDTAFEPAWETEWQAFLAKWVPIATGLPLGSRQWQDSRARHEPFLDICQRHDFVSDPFQQTVEDYVLCQHSRNTFALKNLADRTPAFRAELRALLAPYADDTDLLTFRVKTHVTLATLRHPGPAR